MERSTQRVDYSGFDPSPLCLPLSFLPTMDAIHQLPKPI